MIVDDSSNYAMRQTHSYMNREKDKHTDETTMISNGDQLCEEYKTKTECGNFYVQYIFDRNSNYFLLRETFFSRIWPLLIPSFYNLYLNKTNL